MSEKMNDQDAREFQKVVWAWETNGFDKSVVENPLWKWEPGMRRLANGRPDLADTVTVALIAQQARRLNENDWIRSRGGYERARAEYRVSKTWPNNFIVLHVTPIASGWKIKGLDTDDVEHAVVAERVWQTEGQAWAVAWLLASHDAILREGCELNGVKRDGVERCREIHGITHAPGEIAPVPLSVNG